MNKCPYIQLTKEIIEFVKNFKSDEELLRSGGIPFDLLHQSVYGFTEKSIKQLMPQQLKIRWHDDLENVKQEIEQQGISDEHWAQYIDLSEPIDVEYWKNETEGFSEGFYISDGHHRYYAAKILGKPLNVNLEIKINPITKITPGLGYDDFHRCVFKQVNPIKKEKEVSSNYLRQMVGSVNNKLAKDFLISWAERGINNVTTLSDKEYKILNAIVRDGKVPNTKNINEDIVNSIKKIITEGLNR